MPDVCLGSNQWRSQKFSIRGYGEVLGVKPPDLKVIGVCPGRRQGGALGDFCNFSIKITHTNILAKTVILIENLRLCSSAEAGLFLICS